MPFTLFPAGQKTTLTVTFAALFALAPAAHAQTMAHPAQKPAAAAPAPGTASTDDPARVAAARDFLMAYRPRLNPKFAASQLDKFKAEMIAQMHKEDPKIDARAAVEKRRAEVLARIQVQLDQQSHVISRYFTLQELKTLTAFFSGGAGKKLIDVTPKIQMEMMRQRRVGMGLPKGAMTGKVVVGPDKSGSKPAPKPPGK
jgi:hypothetical protein